jgi:hypothetical protein
MIDNEIKVGEGSVALVDVMGSALSVVNAARVSMGKQSESFDERDQKLIKYLWTHGHTSPFRHVTFQFRIKAHIQNGCFVLVHDPMVPFNMASVAGALHPRTALGPPLHLSPLLEDEDWEAAFLHQREVVAGALARAADLVPRFAIFSIAPIPLIIHLGFLFSDRVETDLFQFDRDRGDWSWPNEQSETAGQVPELVGEPESEVAGDGDAVLRVSLSELVRAADTQAVVPSPLVELAIGIDDPDKQWLQSPGQLSHLRELYLAALKSIRRKVPGCGRLHVFYAGPAAGAFLLGQCVNPRMDPEIAVYEYSRQREPRYRLAGVLAEEGAL